MRQHRHIFQDPSFILDFVQVCDRAVLTRDWSVKDTIFDPRNLIDYIRRNYANLDAIDNCDIEALFDDVCDLVEMTIAASACGSLRSMGPLKMIKEQSIRVMGDNPERLFDQPYTIPLIRTLAVLNKEVAGGLDGIHGMYKALIA